MVLFDEDPVDLIRETTANFHTQSDISCLTRINSSISTLQSARQLRLQSQTRTLSTLSRKLQALSREHTSQTSTHNSSAATHAQEILALDTAKFRIAKQASELEIECERLSSEKRSLAAQLETLEKEGVEGRAGADTAEDETVLKLRVYRSLGIEVERDGETGEYSRAVVRNRKRGDVKVLRVGEEEREKVGRFFCASELWSGISD